MTRIQTGRLRRGKRQDDETAPEQAERRISPWAIAGVVIAFLLGPLGLLVNAYALNRISQTGDRGQLLAAFGLAVSIIVTVFSLIIAGSVSFVTEINY